MALRQKLPPQRPHRFDIVVHDGHDKPILVVEVRRFSDARRVEQLKIDTGEYIKQSKRPAPFFLITDPETIYLYRDVDGRWELAYKFDAAEVFRRYDDDYGRDPAYESYLASLVQVWLNDIADNWRSNVPPGSEIFEQYGLLDALQQGSIALDVPL